MAKKQTLAEKIAADEKKAREAFDKLPAEEQKKIKEGQRSLQKKWAKVPYY